MEARKAAPWLLLYVEEEADGRKIDQRSVRTYSDGVIPVTARN